jgi:diguanylate cyclase (GGDEF)-like protein
MRRDPLTNVNNRRAFEDKAKYLQSEINTDSNIRFAIAVFDVNNLKLVNDSRGHEAGDMYLVNSCRLICNVFKHSPIYRVGGDEFIAVLSGEDYSNYINLFNELNSLMSPYSNTLPLPEDYISIASGVSEYDPQADMSIQDVIKRADELMYKNKAKMKGLA